MCTTITLEEKDIGIILDALDAKKNALLDSMEFDSDKQNELDRIHGIFEKANETIKNNFIMACEKKI